ncbi:MAG: hypothetical protein PHH59_05350 [Methylovulum sp.]|uniref:hypothetical protein n=1 Tax=Methylovulum sp. TaxID=1916980 RepID=UPI00262F757E|nr:hypothetical protein [Methylovulum sp.]MDD2723438.1 hypothetical protein [Methylovulum sp.]
MQSSSSSVRVVFKVWARCERSSVSSRCCHFLAVLRLMLYRPANFRPDSAESLISWRIMGVVLAWEWMWWPMCLFPV